MNRTPLVVAYGMGVDSTAMLVGLQARGMRPDLILFADTGDEKAATYAYLPVINAWLAKVGFPQVTIVKNASPKAGYKSLSEQLITLGTLPPPAYNGPHTCSKVWKIDPQQKFLKSWQPAIDAWARGERVEQLVGYEVTETKRAAAAEKFIDKTRFANRYPMMDWGWDRAECKRQIAAAGLPVPAKSACFHCPNMKMDEIEWLARFEPKLAGRAIEIEAAAKASGKAAKLAGLGRKFAWTPILQAAMPANDGLDIPAFLKRAA